MNAAPSSFTCDNPRLLEPRALATWRALEGRHFEQLSAAETDHLYALYILGLTTPFYGHGEPNLHFEACRTLLGLALTPERAEQALKKVPVASAGWVQKAFLSIQQLGTRDGHALLDQLRKSTPAIDEADSSAAGASNENKEEKHA